MTESDFYFSKRILRKGDGLECPNEGSKCLVNYVVSQGSGDVLWEEKGAEWVLGQDTITQSSGKKDLGNVSEILNECLEDMHAGEICLISLQPCRELQDHLYSFNASNELPLDYKVELVSFEKVKECWELTFNERCQYAWEHKEKGARYYKAGLWLFAARHYSKALKSLILARFQVPENKTNEEFCLLQLQCYSNLAACQLKLKRYQHVLNNCAKVLDMDPKNLKALYRRAQANIAINDFEEAQEDVIKAYEIDPTNKEIQELKKILEKKKKQHDLTTAKAMSKMFQK